MDVRRLLILRGVARAGSISAAARELGWTQPAVSQHLQALERETGCPLVLRGPGGVDLTEAGRALLVRADAIAAQLHMADEEAAAFARLRRGRVRLAAFPSASATLVPRAVAALAAQRPEVDVELTEAEPPEALELLREGQVDLALVFGYPGTADPGEQQFRAVPLGSEPVRLVLPADHRLAGRRRLALADLAEERWVAGCVRCREHLVDTCASAGFEPVVRHVTDDYVVVQSLVATGLGVALLPRSAIEAYRHPDVVVRESRAFGTRTLELVHRAGAESVPATSALVRQLRSLAVRAVPRGATAH